MRFSESARERRGVRPRGTLPRMRRLGMTIPLQILPLSEHAEWVRELEGLGYTDVWTSEAQDVDGLVPLALASQWAPGLRLGCACLPVQTRGPATLAMGFAALCDTAPGRVVAGVGCSSEPIVRYWNALPFEKPYQRTRDTVRFLRAALAGEKINQSYETFAVYGFRLRRKLSPPPPILVAALRPGMLELAGREGDGVILNYVTPEDLAQVIPIVKKGGPDKEIAARVYVCPTREPERVRAIARMSIAGYFNVPTYRAHQEWLGRGEILQPMWDAWSRGDRKGALAALPDSLVDSFYIHGPAEYCRERIEAFRAAGLDTPIVGLVEEAMDPREASRLLAPR
jgi:probable F420-dependent oxidoreductase